ncbi:MAG: DUF1016 N-terminal domain-containing protein, partial [Verrucomicrobiales bacterium]
MKFEALIDTLRSLDNSLKQQVKSTANIGLTLRNWLVGTYIVEFEQRGEERAVYGERLMPTLAKRLIIPGLNLSNLKYSKALALAYPQNGQTLSGFLEKAFPPARVPKGQTLSGEFVKFLTSSDSEILQILSAISDRPDFALNY